MGHVKRASTFPLKLPNSMRVAAEQLAKEDGVSLNQWIACAVAQKVGAVETAAIFLRKGAGGAQVEDLASVLAAAPDLPPDPGDELEPE